MEHINILQLNIQSINNILDLLEKLLITYNIDIALIQEAWTKSNQKIKIKSYNTLLNSRTDNRGGGTAIIIKNCYPFFPRPTIQNQQIEYTEAKVKIDGYFFNFISFYNPNQSNINKTKQNKSLSF